MFLHIILFAVIGVSEVTVSLPVQKTIEPVDLTHLCIQVNRNEETNNKSPVLLIHGLSSAHSDWDGVQQVLALRTGRKICAVDLRNHGDSPWNNRTDVEAMTEDIAHFLKKENIEKINIIGHSLGGKVGVHYSLKNPDKVDSLVVEDMRPNSVNEKSTKFVQMFINVFQEAIDTVPEGLNEQEAKKVILEFLKKKIEEIGSTETLDESSYKHFIIRLVDGKWQWKMNVNVLSKALQNPDEMLTLSKGLYEGPTMFIYGAESSFEVGDDKENILKLFPNAKLVPVKGAGHVIHGKYPQFEDEVIRFLNGI